MKRLLAGVVFALVCALAFSARADAPAWQLSPPFGGCFDEVTREYCAGMIAPTAITGLRLKDGVVVGGAFPAGGLGYAFHLWYAEWYTVTLGVAVAASASNNTTSVGNYANIAGLVGFAKYAFVGTMVNIVEDAKWWYLLAGVDLLSVVTTSEAATFRAQRAQQKQTAPAAPTPAPASVSPPPAPSLLPSEAAPLPPVPPAPVAPAPDTTAP